MFFLIPINPYNDNFVLIAQNVQRLVDAGLAEHIHFPTFTTVELKTKILHILENQQYGERAKQRARRLQDQPELPLDRAIWWIEYLIRNRDATHLRVPTAEMGFIRANSLDIYSLLLIILIFGTILICKLFNSIIINCNKQNTSEKKKKLS